MILVVNGPSFMILVLMVILSIVHDSRGKWSLFHDSRGKWSLFHDSRTNDHSKHSSRFSCLWSF